MMEVERKQSRIAVQRVKILNWGVSVSTYSIRLSVLSFTLKSCFQNPRAPDS